MDTTHQNTLSHRQSRAFQPQKLSAPRNFVIPDIVKADTECPDSQINTEIQKSIDTKASLFLEIGAGKGKHAIKFARENPNNHLIAIERTRNKFNAFANQADEQQLANLTPVHADAIAWTVHAIAPNTLAGIFILYPNPEQHNPNQQWLNMPFFEFLLSRLKVGGKIILSTNIENYIDNAEQQAVSHWQLPTLREQVAAHSQRTHFEVKYLARNETCWQITISKPPGYHTRFDSWTAFNNSKIKE